LNAFALNENPDDDEVDDSGAWRVLRGGSWVADANFVRAAFRDLSGPDYRNGDDGFRVVVVRRPPSHLDL
ncbi:MAG TPA: hypothetical protein EYP41_22110, partial [Anaerolineae bacterium]|nr:hypothetical protein [Anaerolineae bacterium]